MPLYPLKLHNSPSMAIKGLRSLEVVVFLWATCQQLIPTLSVSIGMAASLAVVAVSCRCEARNTIGIHTHLHMLTLLTTIDGFNIVALIVSAYDGAWNHQTAM